MSKRIDFIKQEAPKMYIASIKEGSLGFDKSNREWVDLCINASAHMFDQIEKLGSFLPTETQEEAFERKNNE